MGGQTSQQWPTHARVDSLLFGVLLSYIMYSSRERFDRILAHRAILASLSILVLVIALVPAAEGTAYMATAGYTVNYVCFGALMLLIYGYHGRLSRTVMYRAIACTGRYSYGIYLWHLSVREPIVAIAARLPEGISWVSVLAAEYGAAILMGVALTKLVEMPVLILRDRFFPRGVAQLAPAAP